MLVHCYEKKKIEMCVIVYALGMTPHAHRTWSEGVRGPESRMMYIGPMTIVTRHPPSAVVLVPTMAQGHLA